MTIFDEIQASIARLAEDAGPSVAGIGQRWGIGSGIVLREGGGVTHRHTPREGTVAGPAADAAPAFIAPATGQVPALPWATTAPAIGTPVFALANPGGRG